MTEETRHEPEEEQEDTPEVTVQATDLPDEANSTILKQLFEKVESLEETVEELQTENEELHDELFESEKRFDILSSRLDHIVDDIEQNEIELNQAKDDARQDRSKLSDRIAAIEAELGIEEWEDGMIRQPSCELERYAQMPEEMRDNDLSKNVNRAVLLWEYFEQWSKPVTNGQLLPSSEIRKLLSTRLDTKLEWVQVYRVMEAFEKNSPNTYEIVKTKNSGKSIIRYYDE